MKVKDYRALIQSVRDQFASCRGCRIEERPNEARMLRNVMQQLREAQCNSLYGLSRFHVSAANALTEANDWLAAANLAQDPIPDGQLAKAATGDEYEFVVRFTRNFSEDLECGGKPIEDDKLPLAAALTRQFVAELQDAYDETGMAGHFEIVSGPSIKINA